ncbi:hypothetical protein HJFPF1_00120 [Paramyrothecium foliicola]|nr:hypothetical protein HJFPF1_00120 [Paramyrothecium foliicola]
MDADNDRSALLRPRNQHELEQFVVDGVTPFGRCIPFPIDGEERENRYLLRGRNTFWDEQHTEAARE